MIDKKTGAFRTLALSLWTGGLLLSGSTLAMAANLDVSGPTPAGQTYDVSGNETYDQVNVGNAAGEAGTVNVTAGNTLTTGSTGVTGTSIGNDPTATGTINVTGTGAIYTDNGITYVGNTGTGAMNVTAGGALNTVDTHVGYGAGSNGSVLVDGTGSIWTNTGAMNIGEAGPGAVTISGGATLNTNQLYLNGLISTFTVTGAGTTWTNTGGANVGLGAGANEQFIISDGAIANLFNVGLYLSVGSAVTITGAGTTMTLENPGNPLTGAWFTSNGGSILLSDGATLNSDGGYIGSSGNDIVDMRVTGANTVWNSTVRVYVGGQSGGAGDGYGNLTVSDGAVVNSATGGAGMDDLSHGTITLTGAGTLFHAQATPSISALGNFYVSYAGTSDVVVSDGAELRVDNELRIATVAGSSGTLWIGAKGGDPVAAPGIVTAPTIVFGDGTGTVVFNHTSDGLTFSPVFTGNGTIAQVAGTTILTGASTGFTGTTTIVGGTLIVNGTLGSGVTNVLAGATLGGTGTVGDSVYIYGTLSPGQNGVGTLSLGGSSVFYPGSTFSVEASNDVSASDQLSVGNTLHILGGDVVLTNGAFLPTQTYTLINAAAAVNGAFDSVSAPYYAFVTPVLGYTGTKVDVSFVRNATAFSTYAGTPNEVATANGLDSLSAGNPLYDAILGLNAASAGPAFNYLSGEISASVKSGLLSGSHFVSDNVLDHIRKVFGWQGAGPAPKVVADAGDGSSAFPFKGEDTAIWAQTFGSWGHTNGDGNASKLKHTSGGFVTGVDKQVSDAARIGIFAGYQHSRFEENAVASSAGVDSFEMGLYGGTEVSGFGLRGGASLTLHNIDTSRTVVAGLITNHLTASTNATTAQVFGEVGYAIPSDTVSLEPFANIAYMSVHTNGYSEAGGPAALIVSGDTTNMGTTTLGSRASVDFKLADTPTKLTATAGWRHAFGTLNPDTTAAFSGGTPFTVSGTPMARDTAVVGANLGLALTASTSLGVSYDGEFGNSANNNTVQARIAFAF